MNTITRAHIQLTAAKPQIQPVIVTTAIPVPGDELRAVLRRVGPVSTDALAGSELRR
jgi:hypothetical protein